MTLLAMSSPSILVALHVYIPESPTIASNNTSVPSDKIFTLSCPDSTLTPFLYHVISGFGTPVALQDTLTGVFVTVVTLLPMSSRLGSPPPIGMFSDGLRLIVGLTGTGNKVLIIFNCYCHKYNYFTRCLQECFIQSAVCTIKNYWEKKEKKRK